MKDEHGRTIRTKTRNAWYAAVEDHLGDGYVTLIKHSLWDIRLVVAIRKWHAGMFGVSVCVCLSVCACSVSVSV